MKRRFKRKGKIATKIYTMFHNKKTLILNFINYSNTFILDVSIKQNRRN